ncbi:proline--tRNA ligase [Candidatus Pacearchaeota archaeon ex4484_71]|nr:MAG: proline--tRNA ligase [Candidatus Pacearchaeota archaeon ex4484_71]
MNKKEEKGITVKKSENISEWYEQVCLKSDLVEFAVVKGTMVIKPKGYAIWEKIQSYFNEKINKPLGVKNAYFPLFIPESFFKKEAEHAKGFNPEVAWIDKELTKDGERLAIRPTSETIMYDSYSRWIRSYRDLPLKINQWCNIVRWETNTTKLFLRSREFLWQEGHCVYETEKECEKDTLKVIELYKKLSEDLLAMPVLIGKKTEKEKFAGAKHTYTIEAFMPDGKALQCGTSHNLGQSFAKSFGISFLGRDEKKHTPWQNSWGISTRLIGGLVMTHSDDKGLVLPPEVAENKLVIIPILFDKTKEKVIKKAKEIEKMLSVFNPLIDLSEEYSPGYKFSEYELQGIPLRIEIGPKDIEKKEVVIVRRDNGKKIAAKIKDLKRIIKEELKNMQKEMLERAKDKLYSNIVETKSKSEFKSAIKERKIAFTRFCGDPSCEKKIKEETGATSRCTPLNANKKITGDCPFCGKAAKTMIYFSKSY